MTVEKTNLSPFITFKVNEQSFLFDGGNGIISKVDSIIVDILELARAYDLYSQSEEIVEILSSQYSEGELQNAIEAIKTSREEGFLNSSGKVYDFFEKEYSDSSFKGNLWLNVTDSCNLNCRYCFEKEGGKVQKESNMSIELAKKCIDYWYAHINKEQNIYDIVFFGGEPLLNKEVIIFAINYINSLLKDLKGIPRYNITTNGTILDDELINLFSSNTFFVNVSIDGLRAIHDKNRPYSSGASTYDRVVSNLKKLNGAVTKLSAFICLTKYDIPYFKQSVFWLWNMGIKNVYGNLVFGKDQIYGYEEYKEYENQLKDLAEITYNNIIDGKPYVYNSFIENIKSLHKKNFTSNCYLWQNGIFIFSPNGNAYKCYRFLGDERYKMGNINDADLDILSKKIKKEKIEKCTDCWFQLFCGDGCPYEHDVYTGDINKPAELLCVKSKIAFQESLKLYARLQMEAPHRLKAVLGGKI